MSGRRCGRAGVRGGAKPSNCNLLARARSQWETGTAPNCALETTLSPQAWPHTSDNVLKLISAYRHFVQSTLRVKVKIAFSFNQFQWFTHQSSSMIYTSTEQNIKLIKLPFFKENHVWHALEWSKECRGLSCHTPTCPEQSSIPIYSKIEKIKSWMLTEKCFDLGAKQTEFNSKQSDWVEALKKEQFADIHPLELRKGYCDKFSLLYYYYISKRLCSRPNTDYRPNLVYLI